MARDRQPHTPPRKTASSPPAQDRAEPTARGGPARRGLGLAEGGDEPPPDRGGAHRGCPTPPGPSPWERLGGLDPRTFVQCLLETTAAGLFTVDRDGQITSWNRAMEELTGYTTAEAIGASCDLMQGSTCFGGPRGAHGEAPCPLFGGEAFVDKRCTIATRWGGERLVLKRARLIYGQDGEVVGGVEAVTDVTDSVALEQEVAMLRREAAGRSRFGRLVGHHPSMQHLYEMIEVAARTPSSVLIQGETGTGKELIAHAIHHASDRRDGPFVRVSCAALSETLLESELFGHARGAFTGAVTTRKGRFEAAHGGTLFLDEIGDVSPAVQTKLLRVLQEREFERVGETRPIQVDIRVIAATNRDLAALAADGRFRQDLYYRLAVIPVEAPPLRRRMSDLPVLVDFFIERLNRSLGRHIRGLSPAALERLTRHSWPGNVRELEHAMEFAFAVTTDEVIGEEALPPILSAARSDRGPGAGADARAGASRRRGRRVSDQEILRALEATQGNRTKAAALLGVSRVTLWKWLKEVPGEAPSGNQR